jgi:hypothetical protein
MRVFHFYLCLSIHNCLLSRIIHKFEIIALRLPRYAASLRCDRSANALLLLFAFP